MISVLGITPTTKLVPDKRGSKNQSRALTHTGSKFDVGSHFHFYRILKTSEKF